MLLLESPKTQASDIGMGTARGHTWEAETKDGSRRERGLVLCCPEKESWLGSPREDTGPRQSALVRVTA